MGGAVVCGAFVMAGLGAFYVLGRRHEEYGRIFLKVGVIAGVLASLWMLFPSGQFSSEQVAEHQPVSLAAMEGLFESERRAGIVLIGQPDVENRRIDNPIVVPRALSYLVYQNWNAEVRGLDTFSEKNWPDNIPLLYYSYHVMVGLGTIFIAIMVVAAFLLSSAPPLATWCAASPWTKAAISSSRCGRTSARSRAPPASSTGTRT